MLTGAGVHVPLLDVSYESVSSSGTSVNFNGPGINYLELVKIVEAIRTK